LFLILLKTAMDLKAHLAEDFGTATSSTADPNLRDDHKQTVPLGDRGGRQDRAIA